MESQASSAQDNSANTAASTSTQPVSAVAAPPPPAAEASTKPQKKVQVVGAPPPGPPVPKDDTHTDDEGEDDDDAHSVASAESVADDTAEQPTNGSDEKDDAKEDIDLLAGFGPEDEDLDLSHLSLKNADIRKLDLPRFSSHLKRLTLRQNLITKVGEADLGSLAQLESLDLYDNGLERTYGDTLRRCPKLKSLDYSFNNIKHISSIQHLSKLETAYFVQNKISRVREGDFDGPIKESLTSLELGGNKLRQIENIEMLTRLTELWLGKNKIPKLENISALTSLRILSIQSNRITTIENLDSLVNLEELYISHNGLTAIEGLTALKKLRVLDVAGNRITSLSTGLEGLTELEEFWANDNQIESLRDIEGSLGPSKCPKLETIYLEGNPVQKSEGAGYRRKLMLMLPQVAQIDATYVRTPSLR